LDLSILSKNLIRFVILILLQLVLLNNIHVSQIGVTPLLYVLFIILLPFDTPKVLMLVLSFFMGLVIDIPSDTGGVHAFASVFIAFVRPGIINMIAPRTGYETSSSPRLSSMGVRWFLKYSGLLIIIHHIILFFIEAFSFEDVGIVFLKILLTSVFTLFLVITSQFLIFRK